MLVYAVTIVYIKPLLNLIKYVLDILCRAKQCYDKKN